MAGTTSDARGGTPVRKRLSSDERRAEFIRKSIELFAEEGFESSTRDLAKRLGVTQPLLYRYFPSKEDLISAVYDEVYLRRWKPEWKDLICDRSRPLRDRLVDFYMVYTDAVFHPDWIRIFLYSGLRGEDINKRWLGVVRERIFRPILDEVRAEAGQSPRAPTEDEIDAMWVTHAGIFYYGVIKIVYEDTPATAKRRAISFALDGMIRTLTEEMQSESA